MNEPWECPRCHTVYAPWVEKCECKMKHEESPAYAKYRRGNTSYAELRAAGARWRDHHAAELRKRAESLDWSQLPAGWPYGAGYQ